MPDPGVSAPKDSLFERLAVGATRPVATEPVTLVIFGGAGDLARRKLLPALYNLHLDGLLPPRTAIVGVGRPALTDEAYREFAKAGIAEHSRRPVDDAAWPVFAESLFFVSAIDRRQRRVCQRWDRGSTPSSTSAVFRVIAFITSRCRRRCSSRRSSSSHAPGSCLRLGRAPFARLIVEKPIGRDLASAQAINDAIAKVFDESQIYRIDHYLGKETVQNILVLRFANSIFEPLFNQKYVDHVQITVAEEEGVGTRAGYYEQAGALRDMVQNHLLQLLALIAMEPPYSLDAEVVRDEKLEVLQSLRPIEGEAVDAQVVRAQYAAGFHSGCAGSRLSRRAWRRKELADGNLRRARTVHR